MCLPKILFPMFMFAFIFWLPLYYLAANISHFLNSAMKFLCFSSNEIRLPSSLFVIHVSVNIKNNVEKGTTLLLLFFSLKVRAAMRFSSVAVGCHTCWLSYSALVCLWCGRRLGRCTVKRLPNFLGWVDFLGYGAPHTLSAKRRAWSSATNYVPFLHTNMCVSPF